jgi:hypothetical protein
VVAEFLTRGNEFGPLLNITLHKSKCHPVHNFVVEGGFDNDKLYQRCNVFDVEVFEDLPEVPERVVIG